MTALRNAVLPQPISPINKILRLLILIRVLRMSIISESVSKSENQVGWYLFKKRGLSINKYIR